MSRRRGEVIALGFPYLVAEESGDILGYAYVRPFHARAAFGNTASKMRFTFAPIPFGAVWENFLCRRLIQNLPSHRPASNDRRDRRQR